SLFEFSPWDSVVYTKVESLLEIPHLLNPDIPSGVSLRHLSIFILMSNSISITQALSSRDLADLLLLAIYSELAIYAVLCKTLAVYAKALFQRMQMQIWYLQVKFSYSMLEMILDLKLSEAFISSLSFVEAFREVQQGGREQRYSKMEGNSGETDAVISRQHKELQRGIVMEEDPGTSHKVKHPFPVNYFLDLNAAQ
ncbi:hypothetical protein STEG23_031943, partial [Scotinomys teguina]